MTAIVNTDTFKIKPEVNLRTEKLIDLLNLVVIPTTLKAEKSNGDYKLTIPEYQRIYSWEEKQVLALLEDLENFTNKPFHLGTIILHKKIKFENNTDPEIKESVFNFDIVDGQQRIVTLSLLLLELQPDINISILDQNFQSKDAQNHIAYNKWLIKKHYASNDKLKFKLNDILNNVQFSVLIITEGSLDLAYTFFSNQSSRGKSLTDYELLKAHHLRYIHIQQQAEHVAARWDSIIASSNVSDNLLSKIFEITLFRLRKWMRKREWSNDERFKVKSEFEAAPIISHIPPFGEQFKFYESIQGGTHFFAYADYFIHRFTVFIKIKEVITLNQNFDEHNHWWYKDIINAFLFAYYLKFNNLYINEALNGIIKIVSNHRYNTDRVYLKSLLKFAGESEITMMIDQATSPTFFLAEMQNITKLFTIPNDLSGIKKGYQKSIIDITDELNKDSNNLVRL